ncbi:MAG TPA: tetratricopeptide repeat protein [Spirochaetota bacterium]|nr:tetratricopeptide repeat protein [Spirochaetota bacterium]HRT73932.1 tetratricopeptide repeat protein [Spirochaetota bacterium]
MNIKQIVLVAWLIVIISAGGGFDVGWGAAAKQGPVEPQNIAYDFLDLEKPFGAGKKHYEYVAGLIQKAKTRLPLRSSYGRDEAFAVLKGVDSLLRGEGFVFKDNLLLCKAIDSRIIDCDNYCTLYIAIAEVLKIPIVPVYAPNHSFLRFYLDDGNYINWETTKNTSYDDDYYIKVLRISDGSLKRGVYLKTLGRKEFIGVEYNTIGAYLLAAKKFSEAVPYFNTALRCYPIFSSAYHNRGTALYAANRLRDALDDLRAAADLDPNRASTRTTLADVYLDMKDYGQAEKQYRAAIELDPDNYVPYNNLALIMKETGREEESRIWLKKSLVIKGRKR